MNRTLPYTVFLILSFCFSVLTGCSFNPAYKPENIRLLRPEKAEATANPAFLIYEWQKRYNRIGRVRVRVTNKKEQVFIDPNSPVIYFDKRSFATESAEYTNFIYRIHFPEIPFSIFPFHLAAGNNVGIIVIITTDKNRNPVLITTANTCGCYASITATGFLPPQAYPPDWPEKDQSVYGEILPARLQIVNPDSELRILIRPEVHRVMGIEVAASDSPETLKTVTATLQPLTALKSLQLPDGGFTSMFYSNWPLKGHVKGAVKPWETALLSLISLDLYVGMDKEYGSIDNSNPFYTSLLPWNRNKSDMNNFLQFLRFYGWNL